MKKTIQLHPKRLELQAGACAGRWSCRNVEAKTCDPIPKDNNLHVDCRHYDRKE